MSGAPQTAAGGGGGQGPGPGSSERPATPTTGAGRPISPSSPGEGKRARSPMVGSPVREYQGKLKLLRRALDECISPSHDGCLDVIEQKMLVRMADRVKREEDIRERHAEDHRRSVKRRAMDKQAQREETLTETQQRKHAEHAKSLSMYHEAVKEHMTEAKEKWQTKRENSKLKIHNDMLRDEQRAYGNLVKRRERNKNIELKRMNEVKEREEASERKRRLTEIRLARIAKEQRELEERRDMEREVRKIEWQKRVDAAERERQRRQRRAEAMRREAVERYNDATAFEVASQTFRTREKLRESRLTDLELRKKEEKEARQERENKRWERQEKNMTKNVDLLAKDYAEAERAKQEKDKHITQMQHQRERDIEERKVKQEKNHQERQQTRSRVVEERLRRMDDRWSRNTERCYKYFLETQT